MAEIPERLAIETESRSPAYLVVSDTFDPGWSATVDGEPAAIYPAYCKFRAVYLTGGKHTVVFSYSPAGFKLGLLISLCGVALALLLWFFPAGSAPISAEHVLLDWPRHWKVWYFGFLCAIVLASIPAITADGRLTVQSRWRERFHRFIWDAGIKAMREQPHGGRDNRPGQGPPPSGAQPAK